LNGDLYELINLFCHPTSFKTTTMTKKRSNKENIVLEIKEEDIIGSNNTDSDDISNSINSSNDNNKTKSKRKKSVSVQEIQCIDLSVSSKNFYEKVHGIEIHFYNHKNSITLSVKAIVDDIYLNCIDNVYIKKYIENIKSNVPNDDLFVNNNFDEYINNLTLKEVILYNYFQHYQRFHGLNNQL